MAPLARSALTPPPPLRDGSLDQPLLSSTLGRATSPRRQQHRDKHHSQDTCSKWKRRICRTCCFWRCQADSRDYEQSPPSEPEPRRRDPSQPRNKAVLGRETSTLRQRQIVPLKTARTTEARPQQPPVTSPTRTLSLPHSRLRSIGVAATSWMSALPDHVHLDTLYLPGTHQSLALNYPLASSLCQTTSLTAQLRGGIRCLDLRFSLIRDDKKGGKPRLWAYHGLVPQGREMGEVFQELYDWLGSEEGKRETVIVSIKQENTGHHEFAALVWELIDSTRPYMWYDQNLWPTLGQVRSRCVMFCRFGFESGRGLHPPIWPNDKPYPWRTEIGGRETVVQDWYGVRSPLSIPDKANLALCLFHSSSAAFSCSSTPSTASDPGIATATTASAGMNKADNEPSSVPFRINFLSCGTFPTLYPSHAAKGFGAPRFRIGYRGVNRLVLLGLERLDAVAQTTPGGDVQQHLVGTEDLQRALAPSEEEEKPPTTTGGGDFAGSTFDRRPQFAGGRQRREGQGGMMVLMDFWESPPPSRIKGSLVDRLIEMNF